MSTNSKEYLREWRKKNPEKDKAIQKRYRTSKKGKEVKRKYMKGYIKEYRLHHRDKINENNRNWRLRNSDKIKQNDRKRRRTPNGKFQKYKSSAKYRKIGFNLTFRQFMTFWQKPCHYCGKQIDTIGLDRINSSGEYSLNNVVSCCWECNKFKGTKKYSIFVKRCMQIGCYLQDKAANNKLTLNYAKSNYANL